MTPSDTSSEVSAHMIDLILGKTIAEAERRRRLPEGTYRLQFHADFTFRDAEKLVPYLQRLGISHLYASPYLKARPGSKHGYDITEHNSLNPEIGTPADYDALVAALHRAGLGQIVDTVPNHMGIHPSANPWWKDVLENGAASPYAHYFDISWYSSPRPELHGKILLPILGDPYGKVLEAQQLRLAYDAGAFTLSYYDHVLPVAPRSYALILSQALEPLKTQLDPEALPLHEFQSIITAIHNLAAAAEEDPGRLAEHQREKEVIKRRLAKLTEESPEILAQISATTTEINGTADDPHSFDRLHELLENQAYRLSYWRVASDEINYRRFFDINDLAALSMEREDVFLATHELIFRLIREQKIDGLRIDHPDGLYDPKQYLWRLQHRYLLTIARDLVESLPELKETAWDQVEPALGPRLAAHLAGIENGQWPLYVVVEKILGGDEQLPLEWATYGTSGYDFLNQLNGLFVDTTNDWPFSRLYQDLLDDDITFRELVDEKKTLILQISLSSELNMLAHQLDRLAQKDRWSRDFTLHSIRQALRAVVASFPVYRSYIADEEISEADRHYVQRAVRLAKLNNRAQNTSLFDFIRDSVLLKPRPGFSDEKLHEEQRRFAGKFQQVTAPVMAKGLEDTTFYIYNRLIALNEVGGEPSRFGLTPAVLHKIFQQRQSRWPYALSTTSTHDTKRSEDVRARIDVLSEMPEDWMLAVDRWREFNQPLIRQIDEDVAAPEANEEYLLYQTLIGAWPLEAMSDADHAIFVKRIQEFMLKAMREAKVNTSWINPDPAYEEAVMAFVADVLDPTKSPDFLGDFRELQQRVNHFGLLNGLVQTLLKVAAPGVPDIYQGTEIWDFSLVDPDNRRPVDYGKRLAMLDELDHRVAEAGPRLPQLAQELIRTKESGLAKLFILSRSLRYRREHAGLLDAGEYVPLSVEGTAADHVFAFLRRHGDHVVLVAVPRLLAKLLDGAAEMPMGSAVWGKTHLVIPRDVAKLNWRDLFTGQSLRVGESAAGPSLAVAELFAHFPAAFLTAE